MKKHLFLIPIILICLCAKVFGASAPIISTAGVLTLKDAQHTSDTIPVPINTDDTANVKGFANLTILANVTNSTWNVTPYYSDGTVYHIGTLVTITQDTAWVVDTLGVDTMTIGVENVSVTTPANTITIKLIPFNE